MDSKQTTKDSSRYRREFGLGRVTKPDFQVLNWGGRKVPRYNCDIESMEENRNPKEKRSTVCGSSEDDSIGEEGQAHHNGRNVVFWLIMMPLRLGPVY